MKQLLDDGLRLLAGVSLMITFGYAIAQAQERQPVRADTATRPPGIPPLAQRSKLLARRSSREGHRSRGYTLAEAVVGAGRPAKYTLNGRSAGSVEYVVKCSRG